MYKGEPKKGKEFYNLLMESEEFTSELGKVSLASGRLEAGLIIFLKSNGITKNLSKSPLGALVKVGQQNDLLDKNMVISLDWISKQRNYLSHNIYALFTNLIDETIIERENLLDSDVHVFIERALLLKENLNGLAELFEQKNAQNGNI